jgi:hypothetical protein
MEADFTEVDSMAADFMEAAAASMEAEGIGRVTKALPETAIGITNVGNLGAANESTGVANWIDGSHFTLLYAGK